MDILKDAALWAALAAALAYSAASPLAFSPPSVTPEKAERLRAELDEDFAGGRFGEALFSTWQLLKAFPEDSTYLTREAEIYDRLGDFKSESAAYELSLAFSPRPFENCPAIGRSYAKQGLREKALDADRRCLAFDPNNSDLRLYYALALERNERYDEARAAFDSVLAVAPNYLDAKEGLARIASRGREGAR